MLDKRSPCDKAHVALTAVTAEHAELTMFWGKVILLRCCRVLSSCLSPAGLQFGGVLQLEFKIWYWVQGGGVLSVSRWLCCIRINHQASDRDRNSGTLQQK